MGSRGSRYMPHEVMSPARSSGPPSVAPNVTAPCALMSEVAPMVVVPVVFWGTDPVTRENTLQALNTVVYEGQVSPAQGQGTVAPLLPPRRLTAICSCPPSLPP